MIGGWLRRLRALARRSGADADLDEEIRTHLEMAAEAYLEEGMSPEEARRAARRDFGGVDQVKERHREGRRLARAQGVLRDIRFGARSLGKRPAFSLVVVLTLGLGIGATSAVFSLVEGVLLTPPPYQNPDELALVFATRTDGADQAAPAWTAEQWLPWQESSESFESLAAYRWTFNYLVSEEGSTSIRGMYVTHDYFPTLGLEPALGRLFDDAEIGGEGTPRAIILGYDFWMTRYGGDPTILGQTIRISRQDPPPVVVGIMPPGIRFLPSPAAEGEPGYDVDGLVDYWMPINPTADSDPSVLERRMWYVVGRLRDGVSLDAARAELESRVSRSAELNPAYAGMAPRIEMLGNAVNRAGRRLLLPLLGAAILVLLIGSGNAAALLLVRGLQRGREWGVRGAIGAGRAALVRLVASEALLLALAGGTVGVALAAGIVRTLELVAGQAIPRLDAVTMGWPVLGFGLGAALVSALVAGLLPALRASRTSASAVLNESSLRTSAGRRERRFLVGVTMGQAALTLSLLVAAGLLVRTMGNLAGVDAGYQTDRIVTMAVTAVDGGDWEDYHRRALEAVREVPGVAGAAFVWGVPLTGNYSLEEVLIEGWENGAGPEATETVPWRGVTPGYFDLLGQPIMEGRGFRDSDDLEADRVAVVNRSFVDRYFPGGAAIGRGLTISGWGDEPFRIVGVVSDGRTDDLTRGARPEMYGSMWQVSAFSKHLIVGVQPGAEGVGLAVQRALRSVNPTVAVEDLRTLDQIRDESVAPRRFAMQLLAAFAVVACLLTLGGIYGVLSLSVAARRREMAIRSAVGAGRDGLFALVLREGLNVIGVGLTVGLVISLGLTRILASFLFGVEPTDPLTLAAVAVLFTLVALMACWLPARRAAGIDPMQALREE